MPAETPQGDEITESELEARVALQEAQLREYEARYTTAEVEALGKKGQAFKNPDGHFSFPIANAADLSNAVQALGRAPDAVRDAVKAYIKKRASALGATDKLPESWRSAENEEIETRADMESCPTCNGSGKINEGSTDCPDCNGTGEVAAKEEKATDEQFEWRKAVAEKLSDKELRAPHTVPTDKLPEPMEIRESKDGGWTLTGYPSVTETPYPIGSAYIEVVARGAFRRSLKNDPDVVLNLEHGQGGSGLPLARTKAGTLLLEEHTRGLYMEATLDPLDPDAQLLKRKMETGSLDGQLSFAFRAIEQDWSDDFSERTLTQVEITQGDVSVVVQGANPATSSAMRSLNGAIDEYVAKEQRAGRVLSSQNVDTLKEVLSLTANADENLDKIQPMLSQLLGVANPDKPNESDANSEPDGSTSPPIVSAATDGRSALDDGDFTKRARQKLEALELRRRGS